MTDVGAALSVGTLDEDAWRLSEPGTPHPRRRIEAASALNQAGIPTGVMMAPILPGITDDPSQLREVVKAAIDAGATHVSPIMLHLRPVVREEYMQWLAEHYPELVPRYERMYRTAYGSASDRNELGARVTELIGDEGGLRPRPGTGVIVNRLAESADVSGTASQTGNGRLNLQRAINDASTGSVEPAGAPRAREGHC